ncbi:hypothetical protein NDN08_006580 [Rhodosorus marinus]|uniref:Uncharacterized protein n=1 Tax=Rhodosorus marinus TaxID=101924 RepID=A0AAV8ULT1_9RHOD|nr:hypothetical protein NDN08_006580 [Rhodosorus marinus]
MVSGFVWPMSLAVHDTIPLTSICDRRFRAGGALGGNRRRSVSWILPMDDDLEMDMSFTDIWLQLEKIGEPMLSTEIEALFRNEEAKREMENSAEALPKESFQLSAFNEAVLRYSKPNWKLAVSSFNRNVAFRANRIHNPSRIASFYVNMCNQCVNAGKWKIASSALAYAGIPPSKYTLLDGKALWLYDPSFASPDDIVRNDPDGSEVSFPVDHLTHHVATVMLDLDLSVEDDRGSRPLGESEKFGEAFGDRVSPHEWLYTQTPSAHLEFAVQDMVLAVLRIATWSALEWQRPRVDSRFPSFRFTSGPVDPGTLLHRLVPSPRHIVNTIGAVLDAEPTFNEPHDATFGSEQVARCLYKTRQESANI